jgi:hypothetical protein
VEALDQSVVNMEALLERVNKLREYISDAASNGNTAARAIVNLPGWGNEPLSAKTINVALMDMSASLEAIANSKTPIELVYSMLLFQKDAFRKAMAFAKVAENAHRKDEMIMWMNVAKKSLTARGILLDALNSAVKLEDKEAVELFNSGKMAELGDPDTWEY